MKSRVFQRGTLAFVFAGLTALSVPLAAESEMVGPTFEESISYRNARGPTISPDGKSIAFQVASTDWEDRVSARKLDKQPTPPLSTEFRTKPPS